MNRRDMLQSSLSLPLLSPLLASASNLGKWDTSSAQAYLDGNFAPVGEVVTVTDLPVTGKLPPELSGRYLRNGPNPSAAVDPTRHHWFVGDGMVHGIRLQDGRAVWYRNRYVAANTHVIGHAGKTLALVESGPKPVELTYELETVGAHTFGETLTGAFSAHPKLDPDTGELHVMAYNAGPPPFVLQYVVVSAEGRVTKTVDIPIPGPAMVHDMSITAHWALVYDLPVTANPALAQQGYLFPLQWNPDYGARVGLMPRDGTAGDIVWCEVPLCYVFHPMNAYETEDGNVVVDVCRYDKMFDGQFHGPFASDVELTLDRWEIDPKTRKVASTRIDDRAQEFPRCHPALNSKAYRYGYAVEVAGTAFPAILKHDLKHGTSERFDLGEGRHTGEAVFIARENATNEDDGYLMSLVFDEGSNTSSLLILDAQALDPIASVALPVRVPHGFHGSWISDA